VRPPGNAYQSISNIAAPAHAAKAVTNIAAPAHAAEAVCTQQNVFPPLKHDEQAVQHYLCRWLQRAD